LKNSDEKPMALLLNKIIQYCPDVICISALYEYNSSIVHDISKMIKNVYKKITIVWGGMYASTLKEKPEYVDSLHIGEYPDIDYNLPPDRSDILVGMYSIYGRTSADRFYKPDCRVATIQTDLGCPFLCNYCSGHIITNRDFRKRSIKSVIDEIKMLKENYDIEVFIFNSENAIVDRKHTKELYKALIPLKIKWYHNGGFYVHLMDEEIIKLAIKSGLIFFNLAIESGSKELLKKLKKNPAIVDKAPEVVKIIRKYSKKIYVTAFFLSGFPFETYRDVLLSKRLACTLDIDWIFWNIFQPFKGCELYDYCIENDHIETGDQKSNHYISSTLKNTILDMDELTEDIYNFQLWYNFDDNRCMREGNHQQALRDARHVLNVTNNKHKKAKDLYLQASNELERSIYY
jgi:radical SAM superfamily enzyme YgiQ (UPF0313 family)